MTTLFTCNQSPSQGHKLQTVLSMLAEHDALLLLEDAVIAYQTITELQDNNHAIYALQADLQARAISVNPDNEIQVIDYAKFVELSLQFDKVVAW